MPIRPEARSLIGRSMRSYYNRPGTKEKLKALEREMDPLRKRKALLELQELYPFSKRQEMGMDWLQEDRTRDQREAERLKPKPVYPAYKAKPKPRSKPKKKKKT